MCKEWHTGGFPWIVDYQIFARPIAIAIKEGP